MATVTNQSSLVYGTDLILDTTALTIQVTTTSAVTNAGSTGGVSLQAVYSKLKSLWKTDDTLVKFAFPMSSITGEQYEFVSGWKPKDDATRKLFRTAGWAEYSAAGVLQRKYMGVISLGSIGNTDSPYYAWGTGAATNFTYQGALNEAVQIYGDATNGNMDYTTGSTVLNLYVRESGKTYAQSTTTAIGVTAPTYNCQRFPLSNATDLNIVATDAAVASTAPYNQISVQYYAVDQARTVDGSPSQYRIVVTDASGQATLQQIYTKLQYSLRQNSDIDAGPGSVIGKTAAALSSFTGSQLVTATGVAVDGLNSNFINAITFTDKTGQTHTFPFVAAGTINFGQYAVSGEFKYWVFHASTPAGAYNTAAAVLATDKNGTAITGTYNGSPVTFTFAYDTNVDGGRSAGVDAAVKVVGIGQQSGQYITLDYTISRSAGQSILLAPAIERNYI